MVVYHNTKYNEEDFFEVIDREIDFALQIYRLYIRKIDEKISVFNKHLKELEQSCSKKYSPEQIAEIDRLLVDERKKYRTKIDKESSIFEKIISSQNNSKIAKFASEYSNYSKKLKNVIEVCLNIPFENDYLEIQKLICYYENQKYMQDYVIRILDRVREYFKNL